MAHTIERYSNLLGLLTWGDLGPFTFYRSRFNTLVFYPKAPPKEPPSPLQQFHRHRWRLAAADWRELPPETRQLWLALATKAHARVGGFSLYIAAWCSHDLRWLDTLRRQTAINVPDPHMPPGT